MDIICPVCGRPLKKVNQSAVCENHHCFDYAKSGYLNLFRSGKKDHGDNTGMVKARTAFLESGAYAFLKNTLVNYTDSNKILADLACGEGYYTSGLNGLEKYGIDLSKEALIHAAKTDKSTQYILASIFRLPFADESVDTVVTCFAPFAKDETERILKKGGTFVFVTPGEMHLYELKEVLYEHPYRNITKDLSTSLTLIETNTITETKTMAHDTLRSLFAMTPYAYKTGRDGAAKLAEIEQMDITCSFVIRVYRKDF